LKWLTCLFFVSYEKYTFLTKIKNFKIGNSNDKSTAPPPISLINLLKMTNFNLIHFLTKIERIFGMVEFPVELRNRIYEIEKRFNVSRILFSKYKHIMDHVLFNKMGVNLEKENVFNFTWLLFIYIKG
jgi:hypothetical protein